MLTAVCLAPGAGADPHSDDGHVGPPEDGSPRWQLQDLSDDGRPVGSVSTAGAAAMRDRESSGTRWLWDSTASAYPALLDAGITVGRCHDITLVERILLGREGRHGRPAGALAILARAAGEPEPPDLDPAAPAPSAQTLFDPHPPVRRAGIADLVPALARQLSRAGEDPALRLLLAAESASALAAVEMGRAGLPFDAAVHRAHLAATLGERPPPGGKPGVLRELADRIEDALGIPVNPDSPAEVRAAFGRLGLQLDTARAWELRALDHPAAALIIEYKELSRLFAANGWQWLDDWVRGGRFRAEYIAGGVVSGRWATRGGGALQIPRTVRRAVVADPGHVLVVADASQLEPRVLAAFSGDVTLQALAADADLYAALAADGFGGDRTHAKTSMLGALYGATSGEAGRLLPTLRRRYPTAIGFVEAAAERGERGEAVRSVLGRTSPRPGAGWRERIEAGAAVDASPAVERRGREAARSWGRFTRNFVVQASAADWASVWLSTLRQQVRAVPGVELVFFQHDEVVLHAPEAVAEQLAGATEHAAAQAHRWVFPASRGATPVHTAVVSCYADAK